MYRCCWRKCGNISGPLRVGDMRMAHWEAEGMRK